MSRESKERDLARSLIVTAGGGPSGVGRAVNEAVIVTFMLLFFVNALITAVYFQLVPQDGM